MLRKKLGYAIAVTLLLLTSFESVLACSCKIPIACTAYSRADAVFIGKLSSAAKLSEGDSPFQDIRVHFEVIKAFKGKVGVTEEIVVQRDSCQERQYLIGQEYLVYKDPGGLVRFCNRTGLLVDRSQDHKYIISLSETEPVFTIAGKVNISPDNDASFEGIEVRISNGSRRFVRTLDKEGRFDLRTKKNGVYKIELRIPYPAEASIVSMEGSDQGITTIHGERGTKVTYNIKSSPNSCDFAEFVISKRR